MEDRHAPLSKRHVIRTGLAWGSRTNERTGVSRLKCSSFTWQTRCWSATELKTFARSDWLIAGHLRFPSASLARSPLMVPELACGNSLRRTQATLRPWSMHRMKPVRTLKGSRPPLHIVPRMVNPVLGHQREYVLHEQKLTSMTVPAPQGPRTSSICRTLECMIRGSILTCLHL